MSITLTSGRVRTSVKPVCPNPLFEKWLDEWRTEAANKNSDVQYCYAKALQSLRKYPVRLNSGKECLILKNFGTRLCVKLDQKLAEYRQSHPDEFSDNTGNSSTSGSRTAATSSSQLQSNWTVPSIPNPRKTKTGKRKKETAAEANSDSSVPSSPKKKPYVPALRSGPYAILITLLKEQKQPNYLGYMVKTEIQEKAQNLCDSSFFKPDPGSHYTAWSSMSTIIKKGFVSKKGCPAKFSLTKEGEELAEKLLSDFNTRGSSSVLSSSSFSPGKHSSDFNSKIESSSKPGSSTFSPEKCQSSSSNFESPTRFDFLSFSSPVKSHSSTSRENSYSSYTTSRKNSTEFDDIGFSDLVDVCERLPFTETSPIKMKSNDDLNLPAHSSNCDDFEQLIFVPGDFQIVLLVDTQETLGKTKKPMSDETIQELTNLKTNFEVRHLKVGDFAWVARNSEGKELLLPYIVERKRMDDLGKSIKDGRFHEQKFRLRQCGLENVIYLVEKYGNDTRLGLPLTTVHQAIVNTQIVDNFFVKMTNNHRQSMMYLAVFTNLIINTFKDKTLISCARNDLPPFNVDADLVSLPTFREFSKFSAKNKNMKIQDVFIKHLLQLKGLSVEKAVAVAQKYPTPRVLTRALDSSEKPELLLSGIPCGATNRNIGPIISKSVCQLYTNRNLQ